MTGWYVLVNYRDKGSIPRALGPYPSEEMCRLSAKAAMPCEQRFWTEQEVTEWRVARALDKQWRQDKIAELAKFAIATGKIQPFTDRDGFTGNVNAEGEIVGGLMFGLDHCGESRYEPTPLTGCVFIDSGKS